MRLEMLKEAVSVYAGTPECQARGHVEMAMEAYTDLTMAERAMKVSGCGYHSVYPIPEQWIDELLNIVYYDDVGRLCKQYYGDIDFDEDGHAELPDNEPIIQRAIYMLCNDTRLTPFPQMIGESVYREALRYIIELWLDNEYQGRNNPDGSFNRASWLGRGCQGLLRL